jgi:hypothetical protein
MFDRIDPALLSYIDSEARQLLQGGQLSAEDHQALLDEAKKKLEFIEASIPKPSREDLLPHIHGEYRDRMDSFPAKTADGIWKGAEETWYERHREEAIRQAKESGWRDLPPKTPEPEWPPRGTPAQSRAEILYDPNKPQSQAATHPPNSGEPPQPTPPKKYRPSPEPSPEQIKEIQDSLNLSEAEARQFLETATENDKCQRSPDDLPPDRALANPTSQLRRFLRALRAADMAVHAYLMQRFPKTIGTLDWILGWLFGLFKNAVFGVIATLVLVALSVTGRVNIIVAISMGAAWLLSVVWIAKSRFVRSLTILLRVIVVVGLGALFASVSIGFSRWALAQYRESKQQETISTQKSSQPLTAKPEPTQTLAPPPSPLVTRTAQPSISHARITKQLKAQQARRRKEKALRILHSP